MITIAASVQDLAFFYVDQRSEKDTVFIASSEGKLGLILTDHRHISSKSDDHIYCETTEGEFYELYDEFNK